MGEEPYDAAVRELSEETGITVDELEFIGFTNDVFSQEKHYITLSSRRTAIKNLSTGSQRNVKVGSGTV